MTNTTRMDLRELVNRQDWNAINEHQATWSTAQITDVMPFLPEPAIHRWPVL